MLKGDLGVLLATSYSHSELRPTIAQEEIGDKKLTERTLTGRETNRSVGRRVWASIEVLPVATQGARYRLFAARGLTPRMLGTGQAAALLSSSLKDVS